MKAMSLAVLIAVLAVAVRSDVRSNRIPNRLTVGAAFVGIAFSVAPDGLGLAEAIGGFAVGFFLLLPLYLLRTLRAGDVKLMGMVGTFLGIGGTLGAVLASFVAGGVLAVAYGLKSGALVQALRNLRLFAYNSAARLTTGEMPRIDELQVTQVRLPYAAAIAGGVLTCLLAQAYRASTG